MSWRERGGDREGREGREKEGREKESGERRERDIQRGKRGRGGDIYDNRRQRTVIRGDEKRAIPSHTHSLTHTLSLSHTHTHRHTHLDILHDDKHHSSMAVPIRYRVQESQILQAQHGLQLQYRMQHLVSRLDGGR